LAISFVLAADLGGTKIAVARVSSRGRLDHEQAAPTPRQGGGAVASALIAMLRRLPRANVCAVGVAVPGLAYPNGHVWAPNIPGWTDWPLRAQLEKEFGLPTVVESDRNAFVTGEAWQGAARHVKDVVFLIVGTGIGAGIISGGRLVRGSRELAGAAGWLAVRDEFRPEYKSLGCFEAHAAGPAVRRIARKLMDRDLSAEEVARMARRGNKAAQKILREAGDYLGLGLANLVSVLNPQMIVVGGGLSGAGEWLLEPARRTMQRWGQPLAVREVRVVRSRLGGRAGLLGAAKLALDRLAAGKE
jgi:glucokinase